MLSEHADAVGPAFDGQDGGELAQMPVPIRWLLVAEWADLADEDNGPYVILSDSGIRWVERLGLIHAARSMIESA
jgi:hypothetical protein